MREIAIRKEADRRQDLDELDRDDSGCGGYDKSFTCVKIP